MPRDFFEDFLIIRLFETFVFVVELQQHCLHLLHLREWAGADGRGVAGARGGQCFGDSFSTVDVVCVFVFVWVLTHTPRTTRAFLVYTRIHKNIQANRQSTRDADELATCALR